MKQFIVLMSMVALGLFLYACIAGPGDSILQTLKELWRHEAAAGPYSAAQYSVWPSPGGQFRAWPLPGGPS